MPEWSRASTTLVRLRAGCGGPNLAFTEKRNLLITVGIAYLTVHLVLHRKRCLWNGQFYLTLESAVFRTW
jgi:hypothetical protein